MYFNLNKIANDQNAQKERALSIFKNLYEKCNYTKTTGHGMSGSIFDNGGWGWNDKEVDNLYNKSTSIMKNPNQYSIQEIMNATKGLIGLIVGRSTMDEYESIKTMMEAEEKPIMNSPGKNQSPNNQQILDIARKEGITAGKQNLDKFKCLEIIKRIAEEGKINGSKDQAYLENIRNAFYLGYTSNAKGVI
jgi:hypothetical protein